MDTTAFVEGKKLKGAILRKGEKEKIETLAYRIKEAAKRDKNELCDIYLRACLDYNVSGKSDEVVQKILEGNSLEIGQSLALGLMSE